MHAGEDARRARRKRHARRDEGVCRLSERFLRATRFRHRTSPNAQNCARRTTASPTFREAVRAGLQTCRRTTTHRLHGVRNGSHPCSNMPSPTPGSHVRNVRRRLAARTSSRECNRAGDECDPPRSLRWSRMASRKRPVWHRVRVGSCPPACGHADIPHAFPGARHVPPPYRTGSARSSGNVSFGKTGREPTQRSPRRQDHDMRCCRRHAKGKPPAAGGTRANRPACIRARGVRIGIGFMNEARSRWLRAGGRARLRGAAASDRQWSSSSSSSA